MKKVRENIHSLFEVCYKLAGLSKKKVSLHFFLEIVKRFWDLLPTICYYFLLHTVIENKNDRLLVPILGAYLLVFLGQTFIGKLALNTGNSIYSKLLFSLRNKAMNKLLDEEIACTINKEAELKNLVHDDSEHIVDYFSQSINFLCSIISFSITAIILVILQWKLSLICFALLPVSFYITNKINNKSYSGYEKQRDLDIEYNQFAEGVFHNWKDIRANGLEKYEQQSFDNIWRKIGRNNFKVHLFWFFNRTLITFKDVFATKIILYLIGGILIVKSQSEVAVLIVFIDYYVRLMNDMFSVVDTLVMMQRKQVSLNKWIQFVNKEEKNCKVLEFHSVKFENLSFSYDERQLISGLDIQVLPGDIVGIFGKSGCGKSTLIRLLLKVLMPQSGGIFIDDTNIGKLDNKILFSGMGFMTQEAMLFDMTIYENLLLGNQNLTKENAAEMLESINFSIDKFPAGLDTRVGPDGHFLSGGERQKVIIARTLLRDVQVIVLDEAASALDELSIKSLYTHLKEKEKDRAIILISHDLEASKICNKQIRFEH